MSSRSMKTSDDSPTTLVEKGVQNAEKKNVNLSVNADLIRLAKERKINISALFEALR